MDNTVTPVTLKDVLQPTLGETDKRSKLIDAFEGSSIDAISKARSAVDKAEAQAERDALSLTNKRTNAAARAAERERSAAIRALAREMSEAQMLNLAMIASDPNQPGAARLSASLAIIERGHGKAGQTTSTMEEDLVGLSAAEAFDKILAEAQAGRISLEELAVMAKVIELKAKTVDIEEVVKRLAEMEAIIAASQAKN
jgi:hypothetical protein